MHPMAGRHIFRSFIIPAAVARSFGGPRESLLGDRCMTKEEILAKVQAGELSIEEASKMLAAEQPKRGQLYCKVSEKGGLSVYGLQRMPVTLYVEQWERLLAYADEIKAFLKENNAKLKRKET